MPLYERLFPRWKPKRELWPQGRGDGGGARRTWLGTAGFVIESPETTLLIDPFVTRPGLRRVASRMVPDDRAIARHVPSNVDAVLCGDSHFDHVADAPRIALFAPLERGGLHLLPGIDREGFVSEVFLRTPGAAVITPNDHEPIGVPPNDARDALLAAG